MTHSLEDQVHAELLKVRKTERGLTLATMTQCPILCALLGQGDPALALNNFKAFLLKQHDGSVAFSAAAASLGLASERNTHLARLEEFGGEFGLDQRQVRRYSDRGIAAITQLLTKQWQFGEICNLTVVISRPTDDMWQLKLTTTQLIYLSMREVTAQVAGAGYNALAPVSQEVDNGFTNSVYQPLHIPVEQHSATCDLIWVGEVWPSFCTAILGQPVQKLLGVDIYGNHFHLTLHD